MEEIRYFDSKITSDEQFKNIKDTTSANYNFGKSSFLFGATKSCDDAGCLCREDDFDGKVPGFRKSHFSIFLKVEFSKPGV